MDKEVLGLVLDVDLTTQAIDARDVSSSRLMAFLGGQGLAMSILYEEMGPNVDPMSPENLVVITTGLLTGTGAPASSRTEVLTKSPLTGGIGRGNFGGCWGTKLRLSGYLGIVLRGESEHPVFLCIDDGEATIRNCDHLWGRDTWDTSDALREELGEDFSVLSIGPAGENLVRFACPVVDYYHAPARSHAGCVMGRKKLKAIAVRGAGNLPAADPHAFHKASTEAIARVLNHPNWRSGSDWMMSNMLAVRESAAAGHLGCKNYQTTTLPETSDIWRVPEAVREHLVEGPDFCCDCQIGRGIGCNVVAQVRSGRHAGLRIGPANYLLTIWMPQAGLNSYLATWKAREICQRLGNVLVLSRLTFCN